MSKIKRLFDSVRHQGHREFLSRSAEVAVIHMVGLGLVFLLQILLARLAGSTAEYGNYAWGQSLLFMAASLTAIGVPMAAGRFLASLDAINADAFTDAVIRRAWFLLGISMLVLLAPALLVTNLVWDLLQIPMPQNIVTLALLGSPIVIASTLYMQLAKARRWMILAFFPIKIARPLLTAILVLFIWSAMSLEISGHIILAMVILSLAVVTLFQALKFHSRRLPANPGEDHIESDHEFHPEQLWKTAIPLFFTRLAGLVIRYSNVLVLGILSGPVAAGTFFAAERLAQLAAIPLTVVDAVSTPGFAASHATNDQPALQKAATQAAHGSLWPTLMIALLLIVFGEYFLGLFGEGFTDAALVLLFLVLGQVANVFTGPATGLLNMCGRHKLVTLITVIAAILHVALIIALVPRFGATGAAFTGMISLTVGSLWSLYFVRTRLNIHPTVMHTLFPRR
ncbi:MAG: lipopolysaccharide biosynthesis protein [bacterium]